MLRWWWCCVHRKLSQVSVHSHYCGLSCDFWNSRSRKKTAKRRRKESSFVVCCCRDISSKISSFFLLPPHRHYRALSSQRVSVSNAPRERETLFCSRYILWFSLLLTCFIISSDCGCSIGKYLWMNLHNWWGRRAREAKKRSTTESARREEESRSKATTNSEWIEEKTHKKPRESFDKETMVTLMKVYFLVYIGSCSNGWYAGERGGKRVKWWTSHKREHRRVPTLKLSDHEFDWLFLRWLSQRVFSFKEEDKMRLETLDNFNFTLFSRHQKIRALPEHQQRITTISTEFRVVKFSMWKFFSLLTTVHERGK